MFGEGFAAVRGSSESSTVNPNQRSNCAAEAA
jgi:hypothetical protein